jgi:cytochrome c553
MNCQKRLKASFSAWALLLLVATSAEGAAVRFAPDKANEIAFPPRLVRFVRLVITASSSGSPCLDELEVYGPEGKQNLALDRTGAKATASSCLSGYAIHTVAHLNDGEYGNSHSWIAAGAENEWAQIELPAPARVAKVIFSRDREGKYRDRMPMAIEVRLSLDGQKWETVSQVQVAGFDAPRKAAASYVPPVPLPDPPTWAGLLRYAMLCERATWQRLPENDHLSPLQTDRPALPGGAPYWSRIAKLAPVSRVLLQLEEMIEHMAAKGLAVGAERDTLAALRLRQAALAGDKPPDEKTQVALYLDARMAKRQLMLRDPDLADLTRIVFVKRHPYWPSHNYSDVLDSRFLAGGGLFVLHIPRHDGLLDPEAAHTTTLFDASQGIARDAVPDFEARTIYFAYRPQPTAGEPRQPYWHLMSVGADGSGTRQLSEGPFHDYYPCPLPDGGLAFISTRCTCRFLCWRPQAFVLFRMDPDGGNLRPLSFANLSEWAPSVMRDGRMIWTRSEYIDKGADFGHTLWAIRPDGTHPELLFGNDTRNCYMGGREVPGTRELCCTLISHGGDLNGPIGLIDRGRGPFDPAAITNITPDVAPHYHMSWARYECFRDAVPVSRDYFLVSHAPADRFGLYVIDRYGNRELLYLDPAIGSMCPLPLRAVTRPPVLPEGQEQVAQTADQGSGRFTVADVYQGLEPTIARGTVKYLRVCQEVRAGLEQLPGGEFRKDHGPVFQDFYATPVHKVRGPIGWPSYVAKASLGIVPVEADGSANFFAPAAMVLYFELLDKDLNELQRMRSVVQLQPGEKRSCIGCHENRQSSPPTRPNLASLREPSRLEPPAWGSPFSYEKAVQPVWNARCIACHDAHDKKGMNLTGMLDADHVPASYRTLIAGGWVHYFDMTWGQEHHQAAPGSFGTLQSRLWKLLDGGHYDVQLSRDEMHRVKCWIDLNCPLWPDYVYRPLRDSQ